MASYKQKITAAMAALAEDPARIFVGYGLTHGRALGTIPRTAEILETPVAENLMAGLAIGLSLTGRLPVLYFERMDFVLNALDALVNHLDKAAALSKGEFKPAVIIRITVGNSAKPLFTGAPHTQDFYAPLRWMMPQTDVVQLIPDDDIAAIYAAASSQQRQGRSTILVEYKDMM